MKRILPLLIGVLSVPFLMGYGFWLSSDGLPALISQWEFGESGVVDTGTPAATFYIDFSQDPSGATITAGSGEVLTKNGDPSRVNDGTFPNGIASAQGYAHDLDGTGDYYSRTDDDTFDFSGGFSAFFVITPKIITGYEWIVGKDGGSGDTRGWNIIRSTDGIQFQMWDDLAASTSFSKGSILEINQMSIVGVHYDGAGNGSIWVDGATTATSSALGSGIRNVSADFVIGARGDGNSTTEFNGKIHYLALYDGVNMTEVQFDTLRYKWLGLTSSKNDEPTLSVTSSFAQLMCDPTSGTEPFLVHMPVNTMMVSEYGLYGVGDISNLVQRALFRTCSLNGATEPDGWTVTETAGSGASDVLCDTTQVANDNNSIKIATTAADSSGTITSVCIDIDDTKDYAVQVYAYGVSGDEDFDLSLQTWTDDACSAGASTMALITESDIDAGWSAQSSVIATGSWGTVESVKVVIGVVTAAATIYVDAPMMWQSSHMARSFCGCDTDATCSCLSDFHPIVVPSPITDHVQWEVQFDINFDMDHTHINTDADPLEWLATSGTSNRIIYNLVDGTGLRMRVFDSGGSGHTTTTSITFNAETDYTTKMWKKGDGTFKVYLDASTASGTGGTTDGIQTTVDIVEDGSHCFVKDFYFYRRVQSE